MQIFSTLGIDWKLLLAQLINFAILIGVLGYFVYTPILRLLDERRERVKKAMDDARHIEQQRKETDQFKIEQYKKIEKETTAFLETARVQAERVKKEILDGAQKQAEQIVQRAEKHLAEERVKMISEIQASLTGVAVRLAEKILEREFSPNDQQRMLQSLEKQIPALLSS